jgi:hypothetical protein
MSGMIKSMQVFCLVCFVLVGSLFSFENENGLAPVIEIPSLKSRIIAREELQRLDFDMQLSSESARVILQTALYYSRVGLFNSNISNDRTIEDFYQADVIAGYCLLSQFLSIIYLEELGIPRSELIRLEMGKCLESCEYHATLLVPMPDGNYYLVDPTFRQFFSSQKKAGKPLNRVGLALCETELGMELAESLMKDGFAKVTDADINLYIKAFQVDNPRDREYGIEDMIDASLGVSKVNRLLYGDSIPITPTLEELKFEYLQDK